VIMGGNHADERQIQVIRSELGLNEALPIRFVHFLNDLSIISVKNTTIDHPWNEWFSMPVGESSVI